MILARVLVIYERKLSMVEQKDTILLHRSHTMTTLTPPPYPILVRITVEDESNWVDTYITSSDNPASRIVNHSVVVVLRLVWTVRHASQQGKSASCRMDKRIQATISSFLLGCSDCIDFNHDRDLLHPNDELVVCPAQVCVA